MIAVDVLMGLDVLMALLGVDRRMAPFADANRLRVSTYVLFYIFIFSPSFPTNVYKYYSNDTFRSLASLPAILDIYRIATLEKFGLEWMYWY